MKLNKKKPYAQFYSNGKIVCTGVKSEEKLKKAIIEFDNIIKSSPIYTNLNLDAIVISNISTTCDIKYKLRLQKLYSYLAELKDPEVKVYYNSEHYPAIIYKKKVEESNMTFLFYESGKIVITGAKKREDIFDLLNNIYPDLMKFRK